MKLIPILFSTPMVSAIMNGNKSMTRRATGLDEINKDTDRYEYKGTLENDPSIHVFARMFNNTWVETLHIKSPYGQPGDVLWVREKFCNINFPEIDPEYYFFTQALDAEDYDPKEWKWKPGIHMPFAACRIFLRVKEIRVERLQDLIGEDALKEGVQVDSKWPLCIGDAYRAFIPLWNSINGKDSWSSNPWVWVVSFERITSAKEIAAIRKQWNENKSQKTK